MSDETKPSSPPPDTTTAPAEKPTMPPNHDLRGNVDGIETKRRRLQE
jgi:hypothetical protein